MNADGQTGTRKSYPYTLLYFAWYPVTSAFFHFGPKSLRPFATSALDVSAILKDLSAYHSAQSMRHFGPLCFILKFILMKCRTPVKSWICPESLGELHLKNISFVRNWKVLQLPCNNMNIPHIKAESFFGIQLSNLYDGSGHFRQ